MWQPDRIPSGRPRIGGVVKSEANVTRIRFVSDYSNEAPLPVGFEAHWTEEGAEKTSFYCFNGIRNPKTE